MNRERIAELAKGIGCFLVIGAIVFLICGGWAWLSGAKTAHETAQKPVPDPLGAELTDYRACADGTFYMITKYGKVFWLVGGKATAVECPETIVVYGSSGDMKGGFYVQGKEHLWYLYEGAAAQVKEVPRNQIPEGEHRVTPLSVIWSAGHKAYEVRDEDEGGYDASLGSEW